MELRLRLDTSLPIPNLTHNMERNSPPTSTLAGHMGCWDKAWQRQREENTQHILSPALIWTVATAKGKGVDKIWGQESMDQNPV